MASSPPSFTLPGQLLGPATKYRPGPGTHLHNGNLYASLLGLVSVSAAPKPVGPVKRLNKIVAPTAAPPTELPTISVSRDAKQQPQDPSSSTAVAAGGRPREVLPEVGNIVLCRVVRITPKQAVVAILVVGETVLEAEWQGIIRSQDVRATEKDRVKIYESFRPGDIVRAYVISMGDQANYYLSTAQNELGVIMASSEAGNSMYPVSWKEFKDPETDATEIRKVAKPL